jgi:hypothetical protein
MAKALGDMTEAELREDLRRRRAEEPEPIHTWFELTYSNYLVLHRSIMQSMPVEWQRRFVACLDEMREAAPDDVAGMGFTVHLRDEAGRFVRDPYADYERGRRRVPLRSLESR